MQTSLAFLVIVVLASLPAGGGFFSTNLILKDIKDPRIQSVRRCKEVDLILGKMFASCQCKKAHPGSGVTLLRPTRSLRELQDSIIMSASRSHGSDSFLEDTGAFFRHAVSADQPLASLRNRLHFGTFLRAYTSEAQRGNVGPEFAVPLLERMRAAGVSPDLATYSKLLDVSAHAAAHRRATINDVGIIFSQMSRDQLLPNTKTMNAMLKVCARLAAHGDACILDGFEMFQWCLDSGLVLSDPHLIRLEDTRDDLDDITSLVPTLHRSEHATMEKVQALAESLRADGRISPDVITYNTLVEICAKSALHGGADLGDGMQVMELMKMQGIKADVFTFGSLMSLCAALAKDGTTSLEDAYRLIEMMEAEGAVPDARIFNSLLSVCAKSAGRGAASMLDGERIFQDMKRRGLREDRYTFNSLLDICAKDPRVKNKLDKARSILSQMESCGIGRDCATGNLLLQCARADGNLDEARSLFEGLGRMRDGRSYTIMVSMARNVTESRLLLQRATKEGLRLNVHMWNSALEASLTDPRKDTYWELRQDMKREGISPNMMTKRLDKRAEQRVAA